METDKGHSDKKSSLDDIVSTQEASEFLGLSKRQETRLAQSGQIEGKQWAICKSSILELKTRREAHQDDE